MNKDETLSGFQEFLFQPIIKHRSKNRKVTITSVKTPLTIGLAGRWSSGTPLTKFVGLAGRWSSGTPLTKFVGLAASWSSGTLLTVGLTGRWSSGTLV